MMVIIPLTSDPNQRFQCAVPMGDKILDFIFEVKYNLQAEYWTMTLWDEKTGEMLLDSIPLLCGEYTAANILEQHAYLEIGSAVLVKIDPDILEDNPTRDTLGTGFKLIWSAEV